MPHQEAKPHHHGPEHDHPEHEKPDHGPEPEPPEAEDEGFHLPNMGELKQLGEEFRALGEDMKRDMGVIKEDLADISVRGAQTKELIDEIREDIDRNKSE